jgi:hypothetical protein
MEEDGLGLSADANAATLNWEKQSRSRRGETVGERGRKWNCLLARNAGGPFLDAFLRFIAYITDLVRTYVRLSTLFWSLRVADRRLLVHL